MTVDLRERLERIERARKKALRFAVLSLVVSMVSTVFFVWWLVARAQARRAAALEAPATSATPEKGP